MSNEKRKDSSVRSYVLHAICGAILTVLSLDCVWQCCQFSQSPERYRRVLRCAAHLRDDLVEMYDKRQGGVVSYSVEEGVHYPD